MSVAVDNTFLSLMLHPNARPPKDRAGNPVTRLDERIEQFLTDLEEDNESILIPAPVLSEFLILADKDGPQYLNDIDASPLFTVAPFDQKASIELAVMNLDLMRRRSKTANRRADAQGTWAKISFDRQIVAIAKSNNVTTIYSDDEGLGKFAKQQLIAVVTTWELPLPAATQIPLIEQKPKAKSAIADESEGT